MKNIFDRLEEETLLLELSSAYMLLKADIWRDWEECEEAYSHRDFVTQHIKSPYE